MIERHQDYLINVASVPTSGVQGVILRLDTDAPFAMRLVRSRNIGTSGWNFTTPNVEQNHSLQLMTEWIQPVTSTQPAYPSRGRIIYPEYIYPVGGAIQVDIGNNTGAPLTNAQLLFRGSKLFSDGSMWSPTYPTRMGILPAVYQVVIPNVQLTDTRLQQTLSIKNDADMVYRCGTLDAMVAGTLTPASFTNLYCTLRDEQYKAYSNAPIHANDLFGQGNPSPSAGASGGQDDQVLFTPGLVTPEIYIPRRHNFYFDVIRNDVSGSALDLYFRFIGMKVFER